MLLVVVGMLALPANADIPTGIVDQYWVWYTGTVPPPAGWQEYVNKIHVSAPVWTDLDGLDFLQVSNVANPGFTKQVWVEIKFVNPVDPLALPRLGLYTDTYEFFNPTSVIVSDARQFVTWKWDLPYQPPLEYIAFDSADYKIFNPEHPVEVVEVATKCVPEPMSIMLGGLGLATCGAFRRFRRR